MQAAIGEIGDYAQPESFYRTLCQQAVALTEGEPDSVANAANLAALLFHALPGINWAGFYFLRGQTLVVGPFQGAPACVRIALGRGVCGTAAALGRTQVVPDVAQFAGHVVCDPASRSEFVAPLMPAGRVTGVLDIDSPTLDRFSQADRPGLSRFAEICATALGPARG